MEQVIAAISVTATIMGVIFGLAVFFRNKKTDDSKSGEKEGAVMTELGYIKSGVDDIKRKQERQDEQHLAVITRITAVESSASQAHKRIDELKKNSG